MKIVTKYTIPSIQLVLRRKRVNSLILVLVLLCTSTMLFAKTIDLVKEIRSGSRSSFTDELTNVDGTLFFLAYTPALGKELWKTDGTEAGTVLVKDTDPDTDDDYAPRLLTKAGSQLFFVGPYEPVGSQNTGKLWKSDGTEAGTHEVGDVYVGTYTGRVHPYMTEVNDNLFFVGDDRIHGAELWKSDGTDEGTILVKDIDPVFSSEPQLLTNHNGVLYFTASYNDADPGLKRGLWKSNGSEEGTQLVDSEVFGNYRTYHGLTSSGDDLLYTKSNSDRDIAALWKVNGSTDLPELIMQFTSTLGGTIDVWISDYYSGKTYFSVLNRGSGESKFEIWRTDGTTLGTEKILSDALHQSIINDVLIYKGTDGQLYSASLNSLDQSRLFTTSSGFWSNTAYNINDYLYFVGDNDTYGRELWRSDGTENGTVLISDLNEGSRNACSSENEVVGSKLFFAATSTANGKELWKTETSSCSAPTFLLKNNQWRQVSLPCAPVIGENTVEDVFGDDLGGNYGTEWVVYVFDPLENEYKPVDPTGILTPGLAYWIVQATGSDRVLDMASSSLGSLTVDRPQCLNQEEGCTEKRLGHVSGNNTWNMIGHTFMENINWDRMVVVDDTACSAGCSMTEAETNRVFHNEGWTYDPDSGSYAELSESQLEGWIGFWSSTLPDASNPRLLIPAN